MTTQPTDSRLVEAAKELEDCVAELFSDDATVEMFWDGGKLVIGHRPPGDRFQELGSGDSFIEALDSCTSGDLAAALSTSLDGGQKGQENGAADGVSERDKAVETVGPSAADGWQLAAAMVEEVEVWKDIENELAKLAREYGVANDAAIHSYCAQELFNLAIQLKAKQIVAATTQHPTPSDRTEA